MSVDHERGVGVKNWWLLNDLEYTTMVDVNKKGISPREIAILMGLPTCQIMRVIGHSNLPEKDRLDADGMLSIDLDRRNDKDEYITSRYDS